MTLLVLAMVANTGIIYAQYAGDALRFSQTNYGSSARFKGLGNAQMSLGGDASSISGNPAGLGMFTRSEFSFTPEYNNINSKATYLGQVTSTDHDKVNFNQAGVVFYNPIVKHAGTDVNKGALSFVWGLGYNRNNDFSADHTYTGINPSSSIADFFSEEASSYNQVRSALPSYSLGKMAGDLIQETAGDNTIYVPSTALNNDQFNNEVRFGSTSEFNLSGALNVSNSFYIGASLGFINVRYGSDSRYNELGTIDLQSSPFFGQNYSVDYTKTQRTNGSGINGKIGFIVKPVNAFRIGATFQTPTWLHLEDVSSELVNTQVGNNPMTNNSQQNYVFQYNIRTPYKGSVGASVVIGNFGLITADVDYVDYSTIKFSNAENYYEPTTILNNNLDVKDFYTDAINYRVGGEVKFDQLTLRAGYGVNGTPYKVDEGNETKFYSGGLGYRMGQYYLDLAYQRVETNNTFSPYFLNDRTEPVADVKLSRNNVFLTFGVRF